MVLAIG